MHDYLFSGISCLCALFVALCAEECSPGVLAKRDTFHVPEGGSLSLSCVIQHCGDKWKGSWRWKTSTDERSVENSERRHLTNETISENKTRLVLNLLKVNQSDAGSYGCSAQWGQGDSDVGNLMYVNVTAAVQSQRNSLHRILVCVAATLCLPVILGLARCLSSRVKPQLLPRTQSTLLAGYRDRPHPAPQPPPRHPVPQKRSAPPRKAPPKTQHKTEVVYADISKDALRQQAATREPASSTVYSSVRFS